MSRDPEQVEPNGEQPGFLWKELRHLIEILQDLHLQVSSRLLEKRVRPPAGSGADGGDLDISQALKEYVDTNLGEQAQGQGGSWKIWLGLPKRMAKRINPTTV